MATKHDQILKHIEELPIGDRISVRSIAKSLSVSEGTAYRVSKMQKILGLFPPFNVLVRYELSGS